MPNAADWMTAISTLVYVVFTLGLLIAASIAGKYAYKAWTEQKRANDLRDDDDRRAQAEQVSGWVTRIDKWYYVQVANPSAVPIYNIEWTVNGHGEATAYGYHAGWRGLIPPRAEETVGGFDGNSWVDMRAQGREADAKQDELLSEPSNWRVEVVFRDAAGRDWTRNDDGTLVEGRPKRPTLDDSAADA